jgi:hypothetical protein
VASQFNALEKQPARRQAWAVLAAAFEPSEFGAAAFFAQKDFAFWVRWKDTLRQRTKARSSATWPKPVPHHQVLIL